MPWKVGKVKDFCHTDNLEIFKLIKIRNLILAQRKLEKVKDFDCFNSFASENTSLIYSWRHTWFSTEENLSSGHSPMNIEYHTCIILQMIVCNFLLICDFLITNIEPSISKSCIIGHKGRTSWTFTIFKDMMSNKAKLNPRPCYPPPTPRSVPSRLRCSSFTWHSVTISRVYILTSRLCQNKVISEVWMKYFNIALVQIRKSYLPYIVKRLSKIKLLMWY